MTDKYRIFLPAAVISYGLFLAIGSVAGFPAKIDGNGAMPYLLDKPVGEDGFYMLTVAWHFAESGRLAYNFDQVTTGIQPLGTLVYAVIAKCFQGLDLDKFAFVRGVIVFGTLNFVLFCFLLSKLSGNILGGDAEKTSQCEKAAFILTITNFYLYRIFTYGLETGLYLTLICVLFLILLPVAAKSGGTESFKKVLLIGLVSGTLCVTRLDFIPVLALIMVLLLFKNRISFSGFVVVGIAAFLTCLPWLAFVHAVTGSPLPSSGGAQASLIDLDSLESRTTAMAAAILQTMQPAVYVAGRFETGAAAALLLAGAIAARFSSLAELRAKTAVLMPLFGPLLVLPVIYFVLFWAVHFYARYMAPLIFIGTIVWMAITVDYFSRAKSATVLTAALIACFCTFAVYSLHFGRIGNPHVIAAGYIREEIPENRIVGAFQSGVVGYVNENVVNLDGKIDHNSLEYLKSGNINDYIEMKKVDYIIDWQIYIDLLPPDFLEKNWTPCRKEIPGKISLCFARKER